MTSSQFQESLRIIRCLSFDEFSNIFSNMSIDWCREKYEVRARDMGIFVGGLDTNNMKKLFSYLGDRLDAISDKS